MCQGSYLKLQLYSISRITPMSFADQQSNLNNLNKTVEQKILAIILSLQYKQLQ